LDGLVGFAVAIPLMAPGIGVMIASSDPAAFDPETGVYSGGGPSALGIGLLVLGYLGVFVFSIWNFVVRQGRKGQTLGKTWMHIKVVREASGDVPGVWLALGRYLIQAILTAVTLYLNLLWPLWDAKNQTLHDKVCSTVVIRVQ
ncbi:MAG TPA: RDD family protein, partial [Aeromicrobium sp.]|nr:RDD family protein [Aeromicrobium sp.]